MDTKVTTKELLTRSLERYSTIDIARKLNVTAKTVRNWEVKEDGPPEYRAPHLQRILVGNESNLPNGADFTFIDLFAGIGGLRMGFEKNGGHCVFTSEWDKYAVKTYCENFATEHPVVGDITQVDVNDIPDHDVLLAGFPCQPFSIAGVSKKNSLGRLHGFEDKTQGTLFFDVARIINHKQPKAFLLENVKNLMSHDKGKTFQVIKETLEDELGYKIFTKVVDGKGFVPQHRERNYIVSDKLWKYLFDYAAKHKAKGNGFGYGMVTKKSTSRTLSARYYKDGSEILVNRGKGNPRRLTPRECARLMGYPESFKIPVSDTQSYKQFGNSVVMPVINEIARIMKPRILTLIEEEKVLSLKSKSPKHFVNEK